MEVSLKNRFAQYGINMVDLMMWLVIAALLLAAAIQGMNYYQQATYVYHAKSDLSGAHSWVVANSSLNGKLPTPDDMAVSLAAGELKLTSVSGRTNIGLLASSNNKYCLGIMSPNIKDLSRNVFYSTSDDPSRVIRGTAIPASCGTPVAFAPVGVDTSGAVAPTVAPVVTGSAGEPTKGDFTWSTVPGAVGYKVEQQINTGSWTVITPSQPGTSISVTAVEGDIVSVRVTAINSHGESPVSNVAAVTLPGATPSAYAAWGANTASQLNDGTVINALKPVGVVRSGALTGKKISYVRSGAGYSCALAEAKVYCWGTGTSGQIGNGASGNSVLPVEISMTNIGSRTISSLSVGSSHSCLVASGEVFCWGDNASGKLGRGSAGGNVNIPSVVAGELSGKTVSAVEVSFYGTCAIAAGKAYCWGDNQYSGVKSGAGATVTSPIAIDDSGVLNNVTVTAVAPGAYHTCVLGDGKVYCWGTTSTVGTPNYGTVPTILDPTGLMAGKTISAIASGDKHSCAIADANVYCWGENIGGRLGDASPATGSAIAVTDPYGVFDRRTVTALSVGSNSSCAVASGKVYCWGYGDFGKLGDGQMNNRNNPTPVDSTTALNGKTAMSVNVGSNGVFVGYNDTPVAPTPPLFTSAPSFDTASWGVNGYSKLGDGTTTNALTPVSALNSGSLTGKKVSSVDSGGDHSCALADGEVHCWGYNTQGQLGNRSNANVTSPVKVFTDGWLRGRVVTDLAVGNDYVCVLADGRAYCWGMNNFGQTGNRGPGGFNYNAPVPVGGVLSGKTVTKIEAWSLTTCAVADGKAYCWGSNTNGQLGNGDTARANTDYPVAVDTSGVLNGKTVTGVSVGTYSSCAVADGKGYCWGDNMQGQLGASTPQSSSDIPVAVISSGLLSGKTLTYIGIGNYHACALTSDGKVYCWGFATRGEWGTGLNEFRDTNPHATALGTKVITMLGVGDNSSCALDTDGGVYCWGVGSGGKLGNGTTDNALAPTMVDTSGVLSGKSVSKLWVGRNNAFVGY